MDSRRVVKGFSGSLAAILDRRPSVAQTFAVLDVAMAGLRELLMSLAMVSVDSLHALKVASCDMGSSCSTSDNGRDGYAAKGLPPQRC
ncbi:MAG: hypothetical protein KatS3mg111_0994 [Pirellulaceae bacterium]|nr:MAG: hypothetical protein KatS3mg111_0994 [Pirellulaceae bacterium]